MCGSAISSEFYINTFEVLNSSTANKVGIYGSYGIDNVPSVIVVAKNSAGFYSAIQILEVRNNGHDGNIDSVVFEWAIRNDGSADFTSFEGKKGVSLVKCDEPGFFNDGGCQLVSTPYVMQESRSVQQTPVPTISFWPTLH